MTPDETPTPALTTDEELLQAGWSRMEAANPQDDTVVWWHPRLVGPPVPMATALSLANNDTEEED